MTNRERLPPRRYSSTMEMTHADKAFTVSIGFYPKVEGEQLRPAEVFISGPKVGSDMDALARDCAVLLSLALQYGVPLDAIQSTITRGRDGAPSTIAGAVVDTMVKGTEEHRGPVLVGGTDA